MAFSSAPDTLGKSRVFCSEESKIAAARLLPEMVIAVQGRYGMRTRPLQGGRADRETVQLLRSWIPWVDLPAFLIVGCNQDLSYAHAPARPFVRHAPYLDTIHQLVRPSTVTQNWAYSIDPGGLEEGISRQAERMYVWWLCHPATRAIEAMEADPVAPQCPLARFSLRRSIAMLHGQPY